jgi:hypothetical protein
MRYLKIIFAISCLAAGPTITLNADNSLTDKDLTRALYRKAIQVGHLADRGLVEASGLAPSRLRNDLLWAINDSGNEPFLYAVSTNGASLGAVRILDAQNRDWEDLASFRLRNTAYLLIADVGDNSENRENYFLYVIEEPTIKAERLAEDRGLAWAWRMQFYYEDGPRDCESVAIDLPGRQILLLSKRNMPPVVYRLPLMPGSKESIHVATHLTTVPHIPQAKVKDIVEDPGFGRSRSQPTAMDLSPDGSKAVVLTYRNAYLFLRAADKTWSETFAGWPLLISLPKIRQAEALCFGTDGKTLFVTSEKRPAPLLRLDQLDGSRD